MNSGLLARFARPSTSRFLALSFFAGLAVLGLAACASPPDDAQDTMANAGEALDETQPAECANTCARWKLVHVPEPVCVLWRIECRATVPDPTGNPCTCVRWIGSGPDAGTCLEVRDAQHCVGRM
jgi:hypothetical protein